MEGLFKPQQEIAIRGEHPQYITHDNLNTYVDTLPALLAHPTFSASKLVERANNPVALTPLWNDEFRGALPQGFAVRGIGLGDLFISNYLRAHGYEQTDRQQVQDHTLRARGKYLAQVDPFVQTGIRKELSRRIPAIVRGTDMDLYMELLDSLPQYRSPTPQNPLLLAKTVGELYAAECKQKRQDTGKILNRLATVFGIIATDDERRTLFELTHQTHTRPMGVAEGKGKIADELWINHHRDTLNRRQRRGLVPTETVFAPLYNALEREMPKPTLTLEPTRLGMGTFATLKAMTKAAVTAEKGAQKGVEFASEVGPEVVRTGAVAAVLGAIGLGSAFNPAAAHAETPRSAYALSAPVSIRSENVASFSALPAIAEKQTAHREIVYGPAAEKAIQAMLNNAEKRGDKPAIREARMLRFYMKDASLPLHQAVAPPGNFGTESAGTFDPKIHQGGNGPGRGIAQWEKDHRWDVLLKYANKRGLDPYKLDTQLKFSLKELNGSYGFAFDKLKQTTNLKDAVYVFGDLYENPADLSASIKQRTRYAQKLHDKFMSHYNGETKAIVTRPPVVAKVASQLVSLEDVFGAMRDGDNTKVSAVATDAMALNLDIKTHDPNQDSLTVNASLQTNDLSLAEHQNTTQKLDLALTADVVSLQPAGLDASIHDQQPLTQLNLGAPDANTPVQTATAPTVDKLDISPAPPRSTPDLSLVQDVPSAAKPSTQINLSPEVGNSDASNPDTAVSAPSTSQAASATPALTLDGTLSTDAATNSSVATPSSTGASVLDAKLNEQQPAEQSLTLDAFAPQPTPSPEISAPIPEKKVETPQVQKNQADKSSARNGEITNKKIDTAAAAIAECARLGVQSTGKAIGYVKGEKHTIYLCQIPQKYWVDGKHRDVNVEVADQVIKMLDGMWKRGFKVKLTSDYRTNNEQIAARHRNGCGGDHNPASACAGDPVARPGWSNHQNGKAVDVADENGQLIRQRGTPVEKALHEEARSVGLEGIGEEAWHIQATNQQ